jgi:hypothetical protein
MKIDFMQLEFIHPTMRKLLQWLEEIGIEFTITSLYRPGDEGVHGTLPLRGVDIRVRNSELGQLIMDMINRSWSYDKNRPEFDCALLHGRDSNMHLHLQVHPNTVYLGV